MKSKKFMLSGLLLTLMALLLMGNSGAVHMLQFPIRKGGTTSAQSSPQCNPYSIDQEPSGSNEPDDLFGFALAVGDFNGDKIDDLAVGAPGEDYGDSGPNSGVVYVFSG